MWSDERGSHETLESPNFETLHVMHVTPTRREKSSLVFLLLVLPEPLLLEESESESGSENVSSATRSEFVIAREILETLEIRVTVVTVVMVEIAGMAGIAVMAVIVETAEIHVIRETAEIAAIPETHASLTGNDAGARRSPLLFPASLLLFLPSLPFVPEVMSVVYVTDNLLVKAAQETSLHVMLRFETLPGDLGTRRICPLSRG